MSTGYVGLGNMGGALAARLQIRRPLLVYDLNARAVHSMVGKGAVGCSSLAELASRCDVVFLCLPTSDHVRAAIQGDGGLAASMKPGSIIVDQTTGDPVATRAMAIELDKLGIALVDAPVSGGAQGAEAGTIAIMVGASAEQFARIEPTLTLISANVFHAGGIGAGQVMKLVNNMLSGVQRLATLEAMALALKNGVEPATACKILQAGGAQNAFMDRFLSPHIIHGRLSTGFTLGLMHKDFRLACELGTDSGVPLFFGNLAKDLYQLCISQMDLHAEVHSAALVMDRLAGTHIVPTALP